MTNLIVEEEVSSSTNLTAEEVRYIQELGINLPTEILDNVETIHETEITIAPTINNKDNSIFEEALLIEDEKPELFFYINSYYRDLIGKTFKKGVIESLNLILNILELRYPNRYDYQIFDIDNIVIHIFIPYKSIDIKNSASDKLTINKLLVRIILTIKEEGVVFEDYAGDRFEYHVTQAVAGYKHSHLPSTIIQDILQPKLDFNSFCIGNGIFGIYNYKITIFSINKDETVEVCFSKMFTFFEAIDTHLSWESLEGGPYIKINQIESKYRANLDSLFGKKSKIVNINEVNNNINLSKDLLRYIIENIKFKNDVRESPSIANYYELLFNYNKLENKEMLFMADYINLTFYEFTETQIANEDLIKNLFTSEYIEIEIKDFLFRDKSFKRVIHCNNEINKYSRNLCLSPAVLNAHLMFLFKSYYNFYKYVTIK